MPFAPMPRLVQGVTFAGIGARRKSKVLYSSEHNTLAAYSPTHQGRGDLGYIVLVGTAKFSTSAYITVISLMKH